MAKGRGGLGRGLESLFEDAAPSFESDTRIETLPLREIEGMASVTIGKSPKLLYKLK